MPIRCMNSRSILRMSGNVSRNKQVSQEDRATLALSLCVMTLQCQKDYNGTSPAFLLLARLRLIHFC